MIYQLRWREPRRLPRNRRFDRVFEHRGCDRKQVVCQLSLIVVHDSSLAAVATEASFVAEVQSHGHHHKS